jgi:hypothetical protein
MQAAQKVTHVISPGATNNVTRAMTAMALALGRGESSIWKLTIIIQV